MKIDKGYLIKGTNIQLMLYDQPFKFREYGNKILHLKVTPVDDTANIPLTSVQPPYSYTNVASLSSEDSEFKSQEQYGHIFQEADMIIFQSYLLNADNTSFSIDVYSLESINDETPYYAGHCYVSTRAFKNNIGSITLTVTSTQIERPHLGDLKLKYLVIKPLKNFKCNLYRTYSRHWKETKYGLDVAHRGSGSSFKSKFEDLANIRENTIASLKNSILHGANYVEFDVHITKDYSNYIP